MLVYDFGLLETIFPELPLFGDLGVGLAKMAIIPSKIIQNLRKLYQNDHWNVGKILVTTHQD